MRPVNKGKIFANKGNASAVMVLVLLVAAGGVAGGYYWGVRYGRYGNNVSNNADAGDINTVATTSDSGAGLPDVVAQVRTEKLKTGNIEQVVKAYGRVIAAPGKGQIVSVPFESVVLKVLVTEGQYVKAKDALLEIKPSPQTQLEYKKAQNELKAARKAVEFIVRRQKLKLATQNEVSQAMQRLQLAQQQLKSMQQKGINNNHTIYASTTGIVEKINAREGQIYPAGSSFLEIIDQQQLVVQLGIEPENAGQLHMGQTVELQPVNGPAEQVVPGHICLITSWVNPATRLINVLVEPQSKSKLLLNDYIEGKITMAVHKALLVSNSAVLPDGDSYCIYVVKDGCAFKHTVAIGLENKGKIEIIGKGLHVGDTVVTEGNYELADGMKVVSSARNEKSDKSAKVSLLDDNKTGNGGKI